MQLNDTYIPINQWKVQGIAATLLLIPLAVIGIR